MLEYLINNKFYFSGICWYSLSLNNMVIDTRSTRGINMTTNCVSVNDLNHYSLTRLIRWVTSYCYHKDVYYFYGCWLRSQGCSCYSIIGYENFCLLPYIWELLVTIASQHIGNGYISHSSFFRYSYNSIFV